MSNYRLPERIEYGPTVRENARALQFVSATKATTGPTTIIAAPGAKRQIVIESITLQNETDNAQTILLANSAGSIFQRVYAVASGSGIARSKLFWPMGVNLGVSLSISAAFQVGYTIAYYIEDVE